MVDGLLLSLPPRSNHGISRWGLKSGRRSGSVAAWSDGRGAGTRSIKVHATEERTTEQRCSAGRCSFKIVQEARKTREGDGE